jgi:hypothetical protein
MSNFSLLAPNELRAIFVVIRLSGAKWTRPERTDFFRFPALDSIISFAVVQKLTERCLFCFFHVNWDSQKRAAPARSLAEPLSLKASFPLLVRIRAVE